MSNANIMVILTHRVNEAIRSRLSREEQQLLAQAYASGATVSCLPPDRVMGAILSSLQDNCPVVVLIAEGKAAADFQEEVKRRVANIKDVAILRVSIDPVVHSPDVGCENVIDVKDVPLRVMDAIVAFRKMRETPEITDEPTETVAQEAELEQKGGGEDTTIAESPASAEKAEKKSIFRWPRRRDEGKSDTRRGENEQKRSSPSPDVSLPSPSPPVASPVTPADSPPPSQREKPRKKQETLVLVHTEFFVCALPEEVAQAREILERKLGLRGVSLVQGALHQFPMAGLPRERLIAVVNRVNVPEVVSAATFILADDLSPEEAARYIPESSSIVAQYVKRRDVPRVIAQTVARLAVGGKIDWDRWEM